MKTWSPVDNSIYKGDIFACDQKVINSLGTAACLKDLGYWGMPLQGVSFYISPSIYPCLSSFFTSLFLSQPYDKNTFVLLCALTTVFEPQNTPKLMAPVITHCIL